MDISVKHTKRSVIAFIFYTMLFGIGILLRLYRISQESISLEEYACIANLNLESILHFIREQRNTYPYGGILFPLLQYFWGKIFGTSIVSLRLLSISFWSAFYMLFLFSLKKLEQKKRLPSNITMFVCIGIVFSPALIFLGQEARMYMAYIFFVWCSFFLLLKVIEDLSNRRFVFLWFLTNQLLLWTHHIGIIIWATEFLLLLTIYRKDRGKLKRVIYLIVIHIIFMIPWVLWILTIPPQPGELHKYYLKPSLQNLFSFPLLLNLVGTGGICPVGNTHPWEFDFSSFAQFLHHSYQGFTIALMILLLLNFIGYGYGYFRTRNSNDGDRYIFLLLLSFFIIPSILLFVLARWGPPVFTTRYLSFLVPLHFIGLGFLTSKTRKGIQSLFISFVVIVLLYQFGIMMNTPWRMDWKGVGKTIREKATPQDLILIQDPFWRPIFNINNPKLPLPVSEAYTEEGLADVARTLFLSLNFEQTEKPYVWIIIPNIYGASHTSFPAVLDKYGLSYFVQTFPGEQKIWLYRVSPRNLIKTEISLPKWNLDEVLQTVFLKERGLLDDFYKRHRYDHDRIEFHFIRCAIELTTQGRYKEAGYFLQTAWERNPNQIVKCYELISNVFNNEERRSGDNSTNTNDKNSLFWSGVKCYYENDFEGALPIFLELVSDSPDEILFWWFLACTYDKLEQTQTADFCWDMLFHLQPVLPLGWHFIYQPAAITLEKQKTEDAFHRAQSLGILTDHLKNYIDFSLLK